MAKQGANEPNKAATCRRLKMTRARFDAMLKLPGCPARNANGSYPIAPLEKFRAETKAVWNVREPKTQVSTSIPSAREASIIRKNDIAAANATFDLETKMRENWPRKEVNRHIERANGIVAREIDRAIELELPPRLEGLSAIEIKKVLRKRFSEIYAKMPKLLENTKGEL